jgi:uncharacterized phage infection (PIP) family protein YhgE
MFKILPYYYYFLGVVIVASLYHTFVVFNLKSDYQELNEKYQTNIAEQQYSAAEAIQRLNVENAKRIQELNQVITEANNELDRAKADASNTSNVANQLRKQLAKASSCTTTNRNTSITDTSNTAEATSDLYTDVQRRLDEATDTIARYADEARVAGNACQALYRGLE